MKFKKLPCWYHVLMWVLVGSSLAFAVGFALGISNLPVIYGERAQAYWDTAIIYEDGIGYEGAKLYYALAKENCALFEKYQYELLDKKKRGELRTFCTFVSERLFNESRDRASDIDWSAFTWTQ